MQGSIHTRIRKKARDAQGRMRENLKVYDVSIRYTDASTGKIKQMLKRGFLKKGAAEAFLLEQQQKLSTNTFTAPKQILFRKYLENWCKDYGEVNLRLSTQVGYKRIILLHLNPHLGNKDLKDIRSVDIDKLYSFLLREGRADGKGGLSAKSVMYTHRVLHEALEHAVRHQLIFHNPAKAVVNLPKVQKHKVEVYNEKELLQLFSLTENTEFALPVLLAACCGLRRGECLALLEADINYEQSCLSVNKQLLDVDGKIYIGAPKSEESTRIVPVPKEVLEAIRQAVEKNHANKRLLGEAYQDSGLIVCDATGSALKPRMFSKRFSAFVKRLGLRQIRFHDLRHCAASLMLRAGVDMKIISSLMGHSWLSITADLYTHVLADTKREVAQKVSERLFGSNTVTKD